MLIIWLVLMTKIFISGGDMSDQLPKCIFTTMITFGILTAIVTAIDKKLEQEKKEQVIGYRLQVIGFYLFQLQFILNNLLFFRALKYLGKKSSYNIWEWYFSATKKTLYQKTTHYLLPTTNLFDTSYFSQLFQYFLIAFTLYIYNKIGNFFILFNALFIQCFCFF